MKLPTRTVAALWLCMIAGTVLTGLFCALPSLLGVQLHLPAGRYVRVWPHPVWSCLTAIASVLTGTAAICLLRGAPDGMAKRLLPLVFLPCAFLGFDFVPLISPSAAANILFYVPVLLVSAALFRLVGRRNSRSDVAIDGRTVVLAGLATAIFYAVAGVYFTTSVGEHSGDEGHYLIQASSLHFDGDLDLRNDLASTPSDQIPNQHISPNSRGGHWYSWHSFGLALLLAPFVTGGFWARHAVLGLLAGLGGAGILELCRTFRARRLWAWTAFLLFTSSQLWGVYACRSLPEVGGAALTTWAVIAILRQPERPWGSLAVALVACGYLPWLHTRFIPLSGVCAGFYGLCGLGRRAPRPQKLLRLVIFFLAYLAAVAFFAVVQLGLFKGGMPLSAGEIFCSYPRGMWLVLASDGGILATLPLFACMLAAAVWVLVVDVENRRGAALALILFAVTMVFSCATTFYAGGSCLPGRYLVVILPLFVPCLARALAQANSAARWWCIFLGLVSSYEFALMLGRLPEFGKSFSIPHQTISIVYAVFDGLMMPFQTDAEATVNPLAIVLLVGSAMLLFLPLRRWRWLSLLLPVAMLGTAVVTGMSRISSMDWGSDRRVVAAQLDDFGARLPAAGMRVWGDVSPRDLLSVSDRFGGLAAASVTTHDLGAANVNGVISLPRLESNDWLQRGHKWATLVAPFQTQSGWRACRFAGRVTGGTSIVWAIRQGSRTLIEETLGADQDGAVTGEASIRCQGKGELYILVRLEGGAGMLDHVQVAWTPYSERLLSRGGFVLPVGFARERAR